MQDARKRRQLHWCRAEDVTRVESTAWHPCKLKQAYTARGAWQAQQAHLVPAKVFVELARDDELGHRLRVALRCDALDQAGEEVGHLWAAHFEGDPGRDVAVHDIPACMECTTVAGPLASGGCRETIPCQSTAEMYKGPIKDQMEGSGPHVARGRRFHYENLPYRMHRAHLSGFLKGL